MRAYKANKFMWVMFVLFLLNTKTNASILDWIWGQPENTAEFSTPQIGTTLPQVKVPFEATTEDEKFLQEAKKYTSLKLSDLDSCQHKIVMKIRNSCSEMTEEELAKMSVNLLNCQSAVEGRQQFPCTDKMALRECTTSMDADMWNTYHLMNNRARAVCYAARNQQFRALSEMTVNKLMNAAHDQISTMNTLKAGQIKLETLTSDTMESVSKGHQTLMDQQDKLKVTQRNIQDFVALNLRELTREKSLIAAGQRELAKMTEDIRKRLDEANIDISKHMEEQKFNHKELLQDLEAIQQKATLIWESIEQSTADILAQHASAAQQYETTLEKLAQINATVTFLLDLVDKTRNELDERLGWLTSLVGGTENQLDRLYGCVVHVLYLILAMIAASFLSAPVITRAFLMLIVPLNLSITFHQGEEAALNMPSMTLLIISSAAVHWFIHYALSYWESTKKQVYYLHSNQPPTVRNGFIHSTKPVAPSQTSMMERFQHFLKNTTSFASSWIKPWLSENRKETPVHSPIGSQNSSNSSHPPLADDSSDEDDIISEEEAVFDDGDDKPINELALQEGANFDTFVHFDDNLAVCGELQDEEIIADGCQKHGGDQESGPASSDTDSNVDDDSNLEIPQQTGFPDIKSEFLRSSEGAVLSSGFYRAPPTPSYSTRSRSGTPTTTRSSTPRPLCRAICRNGQPCRNSAMAGSDCCRRHYLDSSFR